MENGKPKIRLRKSGFRCDRPFLSLMSLQHFILLRDTILIDDHETSPNCSDPPE